MACTWKAYDCVGSAIEWGLGESGEAMASGAVEVFAKAIGEAASEVLKALNGVWLGVSTDGGTSAADISAEVNWLVGYIAVASLLVAAIRMAIDRKGQSMQQAFMGMWKVILVGAIATPVVQLLTTASDNYAKEVYARSELGDKADKILGVMTLEMPGLVLIFGLLVMLSSFVQICLMYIRIGVMITLVGTLPLAAAASMTGWGEGWWKKHIGWLAAWLLYKPAAALIIYAATTMTNGQKDLDQTIAGMGMLVLSVFALPALLKLIVPATAALGGTSGGTVAMNVANNIATGAVSVAGTATSALGGGGGGGPQGPAGSPSSGAGASTGGAAVGGAATAGAAAATAGAAIAVQAAATVAQAGMAAVNEVTNSLDDNDGNKGHNE
ncbi:hypothetical protein J3S85_10915 [Streptomyces lavenduligriseus]|nr:hypothetical protein J3S85_10915 [Streptomyces lavenduligriseus]